MGAYGSPQLGPYAETNEHKVNGKKNKLLKFLVAFIFFGCIAFSILMLASYELVVQDNRSLTEKNYKLKEELGKYKRIWGESNNSEGINIDTNEEYNIIETNSNEDIVLSGAGNYYADIDFGNGVYDIEFVSGTGIAFAFVKSDGQWVNATTLISVSNNELDTRSYKGAVLKEGFTNEGTRINITGNLKIRLQKVE